VEVKSDFESLCEQYLLGELSDSDRQQLEEADLVVINRIDQLSIGHADELETLLRRHLALRVGPLIIDSAKKKGKAR